MATRVRFRFNKATGEVEEFVVDDGDRTLPEAEHDRIATAVGERIAARPRVIEVRPGSPIIERRASRPEATPEETPATDDDDGQRAGRS